MNIDGRTLSHEASETIRLMAVKRVREGEAPSRVASSYGLCRTSIYRWLRSAKKGGLKALAARKHPGPQSKLTLKQRLRVRNWINGKDPRQFGLDVGLWTRAIVSHLVKQQMGIKMGLTAVGRMLSQMNITPQKPLHRAYERDPKAIEKWKNEDYPALQKRAKQRGANIFFLDEAGFKSDSPLQSTYGVKGETPIVKTSGQRQSINAISAINMLGEFWYEVYSTKLNAETFIEFLQNFGSSQKDPVFLVVDGHPAHRAKIVSQHVQSLQGRLELHFLPSYAPDLNPDEFVWNQMRQRGTSKKPLLKNESLKERVENDLRNIKKDKELVKSFFKANSVAYTTD